MAININKFASFACAFPWRSLGSGRAIALLLSLLLLVSAIERNTFALLTWPASLVSTWKRACVAQTALLNAIGSCRGEKCKMRVKMTTRANGSSLVFVHLVRNLATVRLAPGSCRGSRFSFFSLETTTTTIEAGQIRF